MNKREFIVGMITTTICSSLPLPVLAKNNIHNDLQDVIKTCHVKFENVEYLTDWLYIFEEEMTKKLKLRGLWKPLEQMKLYGIDGDITKWKYMNWWTDPNFFEQCHSMGMGTDGFSTKVNYGEDIIEVHYTWRDKHFNINFNEAVRLNIESVPQKRIFGD